MPTDPLEELRALYAIEAAEHLGTLNQGLLALETARQPAERRELVESLKRAAHSLKGASRAVGIAPIESVSHRLESVFTAVESGTLMLTPDAADTLYDALDTLTALLGGQTFDLEPLLTALSGILAESGGTPTVALQTVPPAIVPTLPAHTPERAEESEPTHDPNTTIRVATRRLDDLIADVGDLLVATAGFEQRALDVQAMRQAHGRWQRDWRHVRTLYLRAVRAVTNIDGGAPNPEWSGLLEFLNATQRYMRASGQALLTLERSLAQDNLRLRRLATGLQENTRRARLVPFEMRAALLQRAVRDVARQVGKEANLAISGAAVEMDRRVLDSITDPLLHLVRNAVDHGLEPPETRESLGKARIGTITITLAQRGGELTVTVRDDGAGIDVAAVRQQARRLMNPAEVDALSDSDAMALILLPGLSTSAQVTTISGRGVGMDVVRHNVEALQGRVEIESIRGQGTAFRLMLPISLSTIRSMLVRVGVDTYAIPTTAIEQVLHIAPDEAFTAGGRRLLKVGTRTLALGTLADVLERPGGENPRYALIMAAAERRAAFLVDDTLTEQEIVVKPIAPELADGHYLAGATLLGTGEVVIILSAPDLIKSAHSAASTAPRPTVIQAMPAVPPVYRILVVDDSITTRTLEKNILEAAGYDVLTATNGLEALDTLSASPCDAVVADVEMPYLDGFDLTARIRANDQLARLPVILVTSLDAPESRERGLRVGADRYVVKGSFNQHELLQALRQLLG
ncbi:MAG: hybrid sensor histidine kinase/response regulator [Aggregatilineales bacterium]